MSHISPIKTPVAVTQHQPQHETSLPPSINTISGRTNQPTIKFADSLLCVLMTYTHTFSQLPYNLTHHLLQSQCEAHDEPHPLALLGQDIISLLGIDPDTMNLTDALNAPVRERFDEAIHSDLHQYITNKHWRVIPFK